jgi:hypothetical protein
VLTHRSTLEFSHQKLFKVWIYQGFTAIAYLDFAISQPYDRAILIALFLSGSGDFFATANGYELPTMVHFGWACSSATGFTCHGVRRIEARMECAKCNKTSEGIAWAFCPYCGASVADTSGSSGPSGLGARSEPSPPSDHSAPSGSSPYGAGVRSQVFDVIVRQAMAGARWKEICAEPMRVNGILPEEIEAEVQRRRALQKPYERPNFLQYFKQRAKIGAIIYLILVLVVFLLSLSTVPHR